MPNFADGYVLGEGEPVNRIEQALLRMKMATLLPVLQPETRARLKEVANDGLAALDELRLVLERADRPEWPWREEALNWEGIARDYGDRLREVGQEDWIAEYHKRREELMPAFLEAIGQYPAVNTLRKCPFCGAERPVRRYGLDGRPLIQCERCKATGPVMPREEDAETAWDRRAREEPQQEPAVCPSCGEPDFDDEHSCYGSDDDA